MSEVANPKKGNISVNTKWYMVFTMIFVLIVVGASKVKPESQIARQTLPQSNPSQKLSISEATAYLTDLYGEERVKKWKAEYLRRPFAKTEEKEIPDPEPFPKMAVDYLLKSFPQDYATLHDEYLVTSVSVVRFTDPRNFPREAIDVYVNQNYRVYGVKYHAVKDKSPEVLLPHQVTSAGLSALKKIGVADTTMFSLVSQNRDESGFWHLKLKDTKKKVASDVSFGYELILNGSYVVSLLPYIDLPKESIARMNGEMHGWRIAQRIAYIFLCLFILSGVVLVFKNKALSVETSVIMGLFIAQMLFDVTGIIDVKLSQIWGDVGWLGVVIGMLPTLSIFLLLFADPNILGKSVKIKHPAVLRYFPFVGIACFAVTNIFIDFRCIAVMRYIYDAKVMVIFTAILKEILLVPILALGTTMYYRYLATRLSEKKHGSILGLSIAALVSTAYIIVINPQTYTTSLALYSLINIILMTLGLFLLRYDFGSVSSFMFSTFLLVLIHRNNPLTIGTPDESPLFNVIWIITMLSVIWVLDLLLKRSPKLWKPMN